MAEPAESAAARPGSGVALVTQRGRTGQAMQAAARRRRLDYRHAIATGQAATDAVAEALRRLAADPGTAVIALCLDALEDGAALLAALDAARGAGKPVVILHVGIDGAAPAADAAMPAAHRLRQALFEAHGAIPADSHRDLADIAFFLAGIGTARLPAGRRVAILTGGGGGGVITADLCTHWGLEVPPLSPETRAALAPLVPDIASTANPIDLTPEMFTERWYDRFPTVLDLVAADPGIDAIFLPTTFNAPRGNTAAARVLAEFHARCRKPVLVAAAPPPEMLDVFLPAGLHAIADAAHAARALTRIAAHAAAPAAPTPTAPPLAARWPADGPAGADADLAGLLVAAGFEVAPRQIFGIAEPAPAIGFPAVLRGGGAEIGDICDAGELAAARHRLLDQAAASGVPLAGFAARRDVQGRLTLRLLGWRDPVFGPLLACGAGGVHARVIDDLAVLRAPFDAATAAAMLAQRPSIRHALRLDRGSGLDAAAALVSGLSALVAAMPGPGLRLRLDPVEILSDGLRVLDASLAPIATPEVRNAA